MHYESHFGLTRAPFSISPDPAFLYLTLGHQEALAHLLYGIKTQGGFVLLTGEIGAGKTTVCRCLLEQLPENVDVALVLNPLLNEAEFLAAICDELKIYYPDSSPGIKGFMDRIQEYLLEVHGEGRDVVLIVDEAQNLNRNVMEQLRMLTNLETSEKKLLQIILIGQPELRDFINQPELRQMAQRITARFHLGALSFREVDAYIQHRLKVAGYDTDTKKKLFTRESIRFVAKASHGIPRLINILCDRALLGAYLNGASVVSLEFCKVAAREVIPDRSFGSRSAITSALGWLASIATLLLLGFVLSFFLHREGLVIPGGYSLGESQPDPVEPTVVLAEDSVEVVSPLSPERSDPMPHQTEVVNLSESNVVLNFDEQSEPAQILSDGLDSDRSGTEEDAGKGAAGLLLQTSFASLEREAFKSIFSRWELMDELDSDTAPCDFAIERDLRCFSGKGDLAQLIKLNRPAVLTLYDQRGGKVPAVLLDVTDGEVKLELAGAAESFAQSEFDTWWRGEFTLVWRPPAGFNGSVRLGDQGALVVWLLQQLGETMSSTEAAVYGSVVSAKIQEFQSENGLLSDGIVGPRTLIALQNAGGESIPGLFANEVGIVRSVDDISPEVADGDKEYGDAREMALPKNIGGQ